MAFEDIPVVEGYQFYLDLAFSRAKKSADRLRGSLKDERKEKSRKIEAARIDSVEGVVYERLNDIAEKFPDFYGLEAFYRELAKVTLDLHAVKKSLGSVHWAADTTKQLARQYRGNVRRARSIAEMNRARRSFYGRVSSLVKDLRHNLEILGNTRKVMVGWPVVKKMSTVCITGFPNVGKTTLLSRLTGSTPDIQPYAFTTKRLNLGYFEVDGLKIQVIDTPGTLAREKMNEIEMQADIAMKHAADMLVYVWDVTEPYPIADQRKLFSQTKKYGLPLLEYLSKTDMISREEVDSLGRDAITGVEELKDRIINSGLPQE